MKVLAMTYKDSTDYLGNLILKNAHPSQYLFDGGYASFDADTIDGWHYYVQDYMGNNRMVVNLDGTVEQENHYYPYGGVIGDLSSDENLQPYKFEGKVLAAMEKIDNLRREDEPLGEGQDRTFGLDWYDIQARQYDAIGIPGWNAVDPLAEKYYGISPYVYCAGNPVNYVDYNGCDWYSTTDSLGNTSYVYTECKSQEEMEKNGVIGKYLGDMFVLCQGYYDERLGKNGNIYGDGAKTATITVYGKNGSTDISTYIAFTMTSNFEKYGAIKDGIYSVDWREDKGNGAIPKHYRLENGNAIDCVDGINRSFINGIDNAYSKTQKDKQYLYIEQIMMERLVEPSRLVVF